MVISRSARYLVVERRNVVVEEVDAADVVQQRAGGEPSQLTADRIPAQAASHSVDPQTAERLWAMSERLLEYS